jgi:hypothetical protein
MNIAIIFQKPLNGGVIKVGAVVNGSNFARGTTKDLRLPGIAVDTLAPFITIGECLENIIQVAVKMNNRDRTIGLVDAPQQRQSNGVIASKRDKSRQHLTSSGKTLLAGIGVGSAH